VAAFILGYLQGTVRRLLGILSILFSLVLAAQIRGPFGDFLIGNWTQFPAEYSRMLGFAFVFLVASVALTILIENIYERSPVMPRYPWVDPILGGFLGVIEAGVIIGAGIIILDSYFKGVGLNPASTEIFAIRDLDHAIDVSQTAKLFRQDLIPGFFFVLGALIPEDIRALFPH
jgi:colicin V production protein